MVVRLNYLEPEHVCLFNQWVYRVHESTEHRGGNWHIRGGNPLTSKNQCPRAYAKVQAKHCYSVLQLVCPRDRSHAEPEFQTTFQAQLSKKTRLCVTTSLACWLPIIRKSSHMYSTLPGTCPWAGGAMVPQPSLSTLASRRYFAKPKAFIAMLGGRTLQKCSANASYDAILLIFDILTY